VRSELRTAVFAGATLVLTWISRGGLLRPRSHGFYRFFAWEAILTLVLVNAPVWFEDPWTWHQIISWLLLIASLVPLTLGIRALKSRGQPDPTRRSEADLLAFERTTQLVSEGAYKYIRHPLYSSLLLLNWGVFFKAPFVWGALLAITATLFLVFTAKADEAECLRTFGAGYESYMKRTTMFIPYVI
jgi:protein-S-isoprenylcysteine O-methyltransferase Ste14